MHFPALLTDVIVIFVLSAVVLFVFHRLKIPPIIGFLFTGVLAGPNGFGAVTAIAEVEVLAEIGVVLLMFTIGLELSVRELVRMKKAVLGGGGLQVLLSIGVTMGVFALMGMPPAVGAFAGFLVALSSTAIVLKQLQTSAQIESPHGRATLGILVFQDIIIVPMMLLTPLLVGGGEGNLGSEVLLLLAKSAGAVVLVLLAARYVIPKLLHQVAATRDRELFLLTVVALCFLVAWLTSSIGLSLALGAFLAGMIIADSEYSHHALGNVIPFRDLFTSFFFVSVGMLLDPSTLAAQPVTVAVITVAVLVGKTVLASGAMLLLRYPLRTALLTGMGLSQIGEFSFILSRVGLQEGLLTQDMYQLFLSVSVLTMALTPLLVRAAPRLADGVAKRQPLPKTEREDLEKGMLVIGFGLNGRNLVRAANAAGIPVSVIELNPETARRERAAGIPIHFGDATQDDMLLHAGIARAAVVVVAISDPAATGRITERAHTLAPEAYIITRTRFISEVPRLARLGADDVIPEEFETAVTIFERALERFSMPRDDIQRWITDLRADSYRMLRED